MALQRSRDRLQSCEQFSPELLSKSLFVVTVAGSECGWLSQNMGVVYEDVFAHIASDESVVLFIAVPFYDPVLHSIADSGSRAGAN